MLAWRILISIPMSFPLYFKRMISTELLKFALCLYFHQEHAQYAQISYDIIIFLPGLTLGIVYRIPPVRV